MWPIRKFCKQDRDLAVPDHKKLHYGVIWAALENWKVSERGENVEKAALKGEDAETQKSK